MPRTATRSQPASSVRSAAPNLRQRVNISLRASTVEEARALGLNLSRLTEESLQRAIREEKGRRWAEENREAIEYHRRRIERDGMWNQDLLTF